MDIFYFQLILTFLGAVVMVVSAGNQQYATVGVTKICIYIDLIIFCPLNAKRTESAPRPTLPPPPCKMDR